MTRHPYPAYKPSGVAWLGDVPEHWDVKRTGLSYSIQLGKMLQPESSSPEDELIPYLKALHVQWEKVEISELPEMWASPAELKKYQVIDGDLLVCEGGDVGRAGILKGIEGVTIIQNALHRVRSNKNSVVFLMYVLEYAANQKWFEILCNKATIAHFTGEKFSALRIPLPPLTEQHAIAAFLDRETGRMDTLIAKKRRLLELLAEKRAALISRAVTKGLDASVKLKPSGVAWLGDVPEHWEIKRIIFVLERLQDGTHFSPETDISGDHLYITAKNIKEWGIDLSDITYVSEEAHKEIYKRCPVRKGDVLYIKDGATAGIATVNPLEQPFSMLSSVAMLRPKSDLYDSKYLAYHLNTKSFKEYVLNSLVGGAMTRFTIEIISKFKLIVPPLHEQQAIAASLDRETARLDALAAKVEIVIARLMEYRTALVSAAVTGKIDVRTTR